MPLKEPAEILSAEQWLNRIELKKALNRRRFLSGLGFTGAAVAGSALLAGCGGSGTHNVMAAGPTETDVLNFALNLEYLEATFYSYVATGADIPSASTGGGPAPTGAPSAQPAFQSQQIADMFAEIYYDEISHVNDLRSALGSSAVPRPQLALNALGTVGTANYITFARLFEDVGVTAYAGAATDLTGQNLQYAAQILAVEGFHSGAIRLIAIQQGAPYLPTADVPADGDDVPPYDPGSAAAAAAGPTSKGAFFATAGASMTNQTLPGLAFARTTSQVLAIVYANGASGTAKGGFYPAGMNGNITTV
ncbi:MAG: ferritin-like domain-containing protein [Acidobacteriaceae bacterium]